MLALLFSGAPVPASAQAGGFDLGYKIPAPVASAPEARRSEEADSYRNFWKMMNEDWGRANVDGQVLTVFDVRRRVSQFISAIYQSAMLSAKSEMAAAARANPADWDIWLPPRMGDRNPAFPYLLRVKHWENAPEEAQKRFQEMVAAESEQRRVANPQAPLEQITGEALLAARDSIAQTLGGRPENWEIARADTGGVRLRTVRWELLPAPAQAEFRRRAEYSFEHRERLNVERSTLKEITDSLLLAREAREKGVAVSASMVASSIEERIRREPDSDRSAWYAQLQNEGTSLRQERRLTEEEMCVGFMRNEIVRPVGVAKDISRARVSPQRIRERYERVKDSRYTEPAHYRYRQLWLTPADASETEATIQGQAQFVQKEVQNGKPFSEIVKLSINKDVGRDSDGGASLWYEAGKLNEKVLAILKELPDGGVSAPLDFSVPGGRPSIYFIQRVECRPGAVSRLEDVQDEIADEIVSEEKQALVADYLERLGGADGKYFNRYYDNQE
jgi:parvulin-like peptidyl-prolyl isomerase